MVRRHVVQCVFVMAVMVSAVSEAIAAHAAPYGSVGLPDAAGAGVVVQKTHQGDLA
jgi:hypothetical protein